MKKRVAIIGSGNIGTDLLVKFKRNENFVIHSFIGHNENSKGLLFCKNKYPEVTTSADSIEFIKEHHKEIDIVVDCTNSKQHIMFNQFYRKCAFKVIDMTPSKIGLLTVPDLINEKDITDSRNFNLISCGGQTSIPIAHTLSEYIPEIEYLEVVSSISSKSAGPATRNNLDEYIETTELGLSRFTGLSHKFIKVILIVNPAIPEIDMHTSIYLKTKTEVNIADISEKLFETIKRVNNYVPGYRIVVPFTYVGDKYIISVKVSGCGDFLPSYAGNLDIINCACIRLAEKFV
jgi:acetaldehyde dehydrogenase